MKKNILKGALMLCLASTTLCLVSGCSKSADTLATSSAAKGGSMARFTIAGTYMYTVNNTELQVYNIQNPASPLLVARQMVGEGIETIMSYNRNLYLGTQTGMYIYSIAAPEAPVLLSMYEHMQSCDPVAVNGTIAYLTLRAGSACGTTVDVNVLEVIDVTNYNNPILIQQLPLDNPYGLAVEGNWLFVCDGVAGLKIYDISTRENPQLVNVIQDIQPYDVIPNAGVLTVVTRGYVIQYDYIDIMNLQVLSRIQILN